MNSGINAKIAAMRCKTPEAQEAYRLLLDKGASRPRRGGVGTLAGECEPLHGRPVVIIKCQCCGSRGAAIIGQEDPAQAGRNNDACIYALTAWSKRV